MKVVPYIQRMSLMNENISWRLGEFVSLELKEDETAEEFTITLKGKLKYSDLIGIKIGEIKITDEEIKEFVTEGGA